MLVLLPHYVFSLNFYDEDVTLVTVICNAVTRIVCNLNVQTVKNISYSLTTIIEERKDHLKKVVSFCYLANQMFSR